MTSKNVEDIHISELNKLLSQSGLECTKSPPESFEEEETATEEETGPCEEEEEAATETIHEEEQKAEAVAEIQEELPEVFPTPSLRRVLPDHIRKIEEQNRIHVLPEEFRTDVDPAAIPKIACTAHQKYIEILADIVGCKTYGCSLAEFWFLDTLANLLRRAQEDLLDKPTQAVLILWFCEWMKEMQYFDAADRKRMLRRFQYNMLSAARYIGEEQHIPTPKEAGIFYKAQGDFPEGLDWRASVPMESKHLVTFKGAEFECSLRDLTKIIHYIFDLFSTDYQYELVRSVFTFSPEYTLIDGPYHIQNPKRLFAPLKTKAKKGKPPKKDAKPASKGKRKDVDTEEYLALMELKAKQERELEEQEDKDREDWHRKCHILPLNFAATDEFFDKYWPPPTPEPEPEPEPDPKAKGRGKK